MGKFLVLFSQLCWHKGYSLWTVSLIPYFNKSLLLKIIDSPLCSPINIVTTTYTKPAANYYTLT